MSLDDLIDAANARFALTRVGIVAAVLTCFALPRAMHAGWTWLARRVWGRSR